MDSQLIDTVIENTSSVAEITSDMLQEEYTECYCKTWLISSFLVKVFTVIILQIQACSYFLLYKVEVLETLWLFSLLNDCFYFDFIFFYILTSTTWSRMLIVILIIIFTDRINTDARQYLHELEAEERHSNKIKYLSVSMNSKRKQISVWIVKQ